ncbi:uncharacterized protein LOC121237882 isoform X2 [Juglans microcarpa x Juglans regia]|uniref:uncharacterized protein LOC121237882 isoform X2 n=1 Tax=Juglans microcarpa x Juglans regia TaxID=2249226 RepID=UPI001B7F4C1B|nr:uncharacterized protein LOC121237882 isoform X2 [Juglans microcarpa x Juglans regia]
MSSSYHIVPKDERSTVLPEISRYPNVHMLFRNKVISTTTNNEEQVHEDNNIRSRPKNHGSKNQTTPVVGFVEKVEVIENVKVTDRDEEIKDGPKNRNSEVHEETTLEQDADGYLEKKHKGFLSKWKSYKDYY